VLLEAAQKLDGQVQQWSLSASQLVIVDEGSLAGTFALDELAAAAEQAGTKLLLVGDPGTVALRQRGRLNPSGEASNMPGGRVE
jgi:hypothetical protein